MAELNNSSSGQWSETDASNTSPSPDGWPAGTFFNQVEPIGQATMGAIKRFWDRINGTVTSGGSANAYTYTPTNVSYPTVYVAGETYTFKASFANTSTATLNINGLGVKNIFKQGASGPIALTGGEIQIGQFVRVLYDGTQFQITSPISNLSGPLLGTTTNDSAAAGYVGEYISSSVAFGSAVSITSNTAANVTSISLTAGDWDVWGNVGTAPAGATTCSLVIAYIGTTSATLPADPNSGALSRLGITFTAGTNQTFPVGMTRLSLSTTTTVYLGVFSTFGVSTNAAYGFIGARRRR